ncbi:MAG: PD-(D/E)XK nuclease family protein [Ignisphaera sp.]|nr:PD-(D/E)XK nuclease family protein [Ignisphaera sp.]
MAQTLFDNAGVELTGRTLRPSSVDNFYGCGWQWYNVFVLGKNTIPSLRANVGTAIHKCAEVMWNEAIISGSKDLNLTRAKDAAIQEFQEIQSKEAGKDPRLTASEAEVLVKGGAVAFMQDIAPITDIPIAVEHRFSKPIDNSWFTSLSGTVDYISLDTIGDIKSTSKTISSGAGYLTQQSIYKHLAKFNGLPIEHNIIQGVILTKIPKGQILSMEANEDRALYLVENLLDTMDIMTKDIIDPKILFRGNPKHMFCSPSYCNLYYECIFVKETAPEVKQSIATSVDSIEI